MTDYNKLQEAKEQEEKKKNKEYVVNLDLYGKWRKSYNPNSSINKKYTFIDTTHAKTRFIDHLLNCNVSYFEFIQECPHTVSFIRCLYMLKNQKEEKKHFVYMEVPLEVPYLKWDMDTEGGDTKMELYRNPNERGIWDLINTDFEHAREDFVYVGHCISQIQPLVSTSPPSNINYYVPTPKNSFLSRQSMQEGAKPNN